MATCKRIVPESPAFELRLTDEEARILHALLGRCAGGGITGPIFDALDAMGIDGDAFEVDTEDVIGVMKRGDL